MNNLKLTNGELAHLYSALTTALIYSRKHLSIWKEISEKNPSAKSCINMTELEISSYSDLMKKIESIRGF